MAEFKIKHLVSGGLITNYFCASRCRHCLYNCSPHWDKKYPLLTTLFDHGVRGILKMAQEKFDYTPAKDSYINKCDLCTEIRTLFVKKDFGGPAELQPRQFYQKK